jgi:hypothetical protein
MTMTQQQPEHGRWRGRLTVAIVTTALVACGFTLLAQTTAPNTATPANVLTAEERSGGWRLLFDGKTTRGWHTFGRDTVVGWDIKDGELIALGQGGDHANDIVTNESFGSFELVVDWKLAPRANSGILYHVVEKGYDAVYATGPEYQLIDVEGWPDKLETWQWTGANYAMHPPLSAAWKRVGEWNHTRILVNGTDVEHWLNGVKVVDYQLWTPDWQARVQAGKWNDYPGYGKAKTGLVGLQDHGNRIWFRNIKIKPL